MLTQVDEAVDEPATVADRSMRGIADLSHDRGEVPDPVRRQRVEVGDRVGEQPRRDRDRHALGQTPVAQHLVQQGSPRTAVAVDERMDRLELGMSERRLDQDREIGACHEVDQISDEVGDA